MGVSVQIAAPKDVMQVTALDLLHEAEQTPAYPQKAGTSRIVEFAGNGGRHSRT
jgi:hypothetical protein